MNRLHAVALCLMLMLPLFARPASAATTCTGSMTNLNFAATSGGVTDATATFSVTCNTFGLSLLANARVNMCVSIFSGTDGGGTLNPRRLINTFSDPMNMQLYTDAARTAIWGARGNATVPNPVLLQFTYSVPVLGGSETQNVTLYGRIPAQTGLNAGTYVNRFTAATDTLIEFRYAEQLLGTPPMPASCTSGGSAGTSSQFPFTVNGSVPNSCTLTPKPVPNMAFGSVPGPITSNVDQTTSIGLVCSGRTAWQIGLNNGLYASGATRRMRNGAGQFVVYELYRNSPRTQRWGNTLGSDTLTGTGTGTSQSLPVYGRVGAQTPSIGSYSDTITVTVTY
ncbi:Csu type fimbrial protein [Lysobacter antibioticus]|uniref:Csu type fimbrial protein n=1 Tax=Lysobacter antibioticus TaxID=84531 RepID=UPI00071731AD|nr:spore coat U domain-containing protein [Lysobacter antibioticus]